MTDFIPVPDRQIVWSRLLAPKSPSFTLPAESRRIFAPGRKRTLWCFVFFFLKKRKQLEFSDAVQDSSRGLELPENFYVHSYYFTQRFIQ